MSFYICYFDNLYIVLKPLLLFISVVKNINFFKSSLFYLI
uniref:Uncharacterized protein n=1 Tax=Dipterosiphonia australica TaxID=2007208 RepID=A0A1Z1MLU4_9FLOR|nr:hypothetical protein [Dipterosiphonia australica]ARW66765.1 hypothetical protein [Dipterosiphonia australica]